MGAKLYGFKIKGPSSVPVTDLCTRLINRSGESFSLGQRIRFPYVVRCDDWLHASIFTQKPKGDHPVGELDGDGNLTVRVESADNLPDLFATTCIAFSIRRNRGVVASYRGGLSILQLCRWLGREYRELVRQERDALLAAIPPGMTERQIKKDYPLQGAIDCQPLLEQNTLERTLERLDSISKIKVAVPKRAGDPASPLRMIARTVDVVVNVEAAVRRDKTWRDKIADMLNLNNSVDATFTGETTDGKEETIAINDEIFALDNYDRAKLLDAEHHEPEFLCEASIFAELRSFVDSNPLLFGS